MSLSIQTLPSFIEQLSAAQQRLIRQIFTVNSSQTKLTIPSSFRKTVHGHFSKKDADGNLLESEDAVVHHVENQTVVKVTNRWTGEGSFFNWVRGFRPGVPKKNIKKDQELVSHLISATAEHCDFCHPYECTPEDPFGRVLGKHCITASNIAKYDAYHCLIIFNNHNPLQFDNAEFADYMHTACAWFDTAYRFDAHYATPYLLWNCLPRSGSSQVHGHMQALMSDGYLAKIALLKERAEAYKKKYKQSYFEDFYSIHELLGLGMTKQSVHIMAHLTPMKTKEVVLIAHEINDAFIETIFTVLRHFIDKLHVSNFNFSLAMPSFGIKEKTLPCIVRIVDRGSLIYKSSDIGTPELFAQNVSAGDPYDLMKELRSITL